MRGLYIPGDAPPWRKDFEAELLRFPAGVHDDMVDALGLIGQLLDRVRPGVAPKAPPKPNDGLSGYKAMRSGGGSWRV
ncbi:hypothetical protein MKK67_18520 [Methylobacterium sp. J-072]|uniref:hypothetical protein n=1 Tax=Methylobacterium sp. J-072 TaxID=2836651 RepID=UPI001FB8ABD4|nr:hypothetical protein [Methylobacterium sp. J-072]MCJ2094469.1 hypothetical protein [Methylobacterium sp. J-072]